MKFSIRSLVVLSLLVLNLMQAGPTKSAVDQRLGHWAYQPVQRPAIPNVRPHVSHISNSIDTFIVAKLAEKQLSPSPQADRRTLIRRLSFDLLGLPPTPERVEQFVNDRDPKAWEKLVDEFLSSPHYGERWARHWLDIAHYADTHGFERDQLRPNAWRYRDYVIASLNADKPYNEFLREQIAGDVLVAEANSAARNSELITATGFLAVGPWDFVGQVETKSDMLKRAARADDLDDMVTQVMTAACGVTINCARCHDHKLDPISQREYYSLWAVFVGVKRSERDVNPAGSARREVERKQLQARLREIHSELGRLAGEGLSLADMVGGGNGRGTGVKGAGLDLRTGNFVEGKLGYHRDIMVNRLQKPEWRETKAPKFVQWIFVPDGRSPVPVAFKAETTNLPPTSGHAWDAIRNGPLNAQVSTKIDGVDYASAGHSIFGLHANAGITFDLAEIRRTSGFSDLRFTAMVGFGAKKEAVASRADFSVFVDGELRFQRLRMRKDEAACVEVAIPITAKSVTLVATDGGDGIGSDLLFLGDARLTPDADSRQLTEADRKHVDLLRAEEKKLTASLNEKSVEEKVYAITNFAPPVVKVLFRGNPEDTREEVTPGVIACVKGPRAHFGGNDLPEGRRRLALADWIVSPENPLTRRVIVNRLWHHHFGQGIVTTPSDFGFGGDRPSHPELLDWLASEFLRSGWSLKAMHRLICTSATYKRSSTDVDKGSSFASVQKDSGNRLLWRQNPRRLDAESVRDAVLAASGKLNLAMGGPGYRDFKYTEAYAPIYDYVTADTPELWRRSIYRFIVRTTPQHFMTTLDCPNPANLTPARISTTTALQALALSNNEFMLQQARHFAARLEREAGTELPVQITRAFQLAFARPPTRGELHAASQLVHDESLFALCRMLLNANEFVYVD